MLNFLNGSTARNESSSSFFIRMPLKNASGRKMKLVTLFQKLSRTLSRLTNASARSTQVSFAGSTGARGVGRWRTLRAGESSVSGGASIVVTVTVQ